MKNIVKRFGWLVSLTAAMVMSTLSLYFVGIHYGLPVYAAALTSACIDGAAIVTANQAIEAAERQESSFGPSMWVVVFAGASAYFNAQHAFILGGPNAARYFYALPPIVAVVIYERHIKDVRDKASKRAVHLPRFERAVWFMFPFRTFKIMRNTIGAELTVYEGENLSLIANATPETIRIWAKTNGVKVNDRGPLPSAVVKAFLAQNNNSPRVSPSFPEFPRVSETPSASSNGTLFIKDNS